MNGSCLWLSVQHWTASPTKEGCHWQAGGENRQTWQSWQIQPDILNPPLLRLTSRKPLWLDLQPVDIKSRWRHNWKSAQVVNSHLVCDPTIRQPGFDLPRQQWSLLNRFRTEQGHCGACRRKWRLTDTDLCPCGETQTMSHIVESCSLTKLNSGLSRLHSADEDAVSLLINYGSWHAHEQKKYSRPTMEFPSKKRTGIHTLAFIYHLWQRIIPDDIACTLLVSLLHWLFPSDVDCQNLLLSLSPATA